MNEVVTTVRCQYMVVGEDGSQHQCGRPAVAPNYPYCLVHSKSISSPAKRGRFKRYEESMPDYARTPYEHQLDDNKPEDLIPELARIRSLLNLYDEKLRATIDEVTGVQAMMTHKDISTIAALTEQIRRLCESQAKINPAKYIPLSDMNKIVSDIIEIIRAQIPAEHITIREKIAAALQKYGKEEMGHYVVEGPQHEGS